MKSSNLSAVFKVKHFLKWLHFPLLCPSRPVCVEMALTLNTAEHSNYGRERQLSIFINRTLGKMGSRQPLCTLKYFIEQPEFNDPLKSERKFVCWVLLHFRFYFNSSLARKIWLTTKLNRNSRTCEFHVHFISEVVHHHGTRCSNLIP